MQLRYRMLMFKMSRLAGQDKLTAVQEIGFATELAELVQKEGLAERVVQELFDDAHPQIRRIAVNAIRRTGQFEVNGLQGALLRRLSDPEPWVRHDAAWVIQEAKMDGGLLRAGLRRLAGSVQLPQDAVRAKENPTDGLLQAQVRARQILDAMLKKDAEAALAALRAAMAALSGLQKDPYSNGTVGKLNQERRQLQRRIAARALSSSTRLTFKRVEGPDGKPVFSPVAAAARKRAEGEPA
ncbi:hypothetical protein [Cupriavidus sp. AU9028]|uniref:hypothetical protein n=1 Tax=Cupriavidus sp. AU9028 TaxID=2871157 RepID=UPI0021056DE5|nr:hypothetical protein [Cupriavidus sp. AU9028]